jgi:hypothetical protein
LKPGKGEGLPGIPVLNAEGQFSGLPYSEAGGLALPEKFGVIGAGVLPVLKNTDSQFAGHDTAVRDQDFKGTERQGLGALGDKKKFHRGPASSIGGSPPAHGADLSQNQGVWKDRRVYLYFRRPGVIRENGNGPDMVHDGIFRKIFQTDFRPCLNAGISGSGEKIWRGKNDEESAKAKALKPRIAP